MLCMLTVLAVFCQSCARRTSKEYVMKGTKITSTSDLRYSFTPGSCTTGDHHFANRTQMCVTLLNDTDNKNCARLERQALYNQVCI